MGILIEAPVNSRVAMYRKGTRLMLVNGYWSIHDVSAHNSSQSNSEAVIMTKTLGGLKPMVWRCVMGRELQDFRRRCADPLAPVRVVQLTSSKQHCTSLAR